ncbi:MAG: PSD1 and planctomycete cytochrome C domain-containing protein [Pirellulaceae bacterium]
MQFLASRIVFNLSYILVSCVLSHTLFADERPIDYNRDVRPILSDKCFYCHGPDASHREADLRLDDEQSAKEAGVIVPESPQESELWSRLVTSDVDLRMPPADSGKQLAEEEVKLLEQWIEQGAPYAAYWAFVEPQAHSVPSVAEDDWSQMPSDRFILDRLRNEQLSPSPRAEFSTLARRVSFDLTGLPPSVEQMAEFGSDSEDDAYEQLVEQLLASPRYGERMAVYWLDLVRYADTVGYHGDQDHNISPYRDYVIDAFNSNLPFDQFTREQLAGDLLPSPTLQQRIATGYNRLLQTTHEGGLQPKEYLAIYAADRVRNLSAVWMGATVGCAQCHDHKFDPYTLKDFYALAAFFADIDEEKHFTNGGNSLPTRRDPEIPVFTDEQQREVDQLTEKIDSIRSSGLTDKKKVEQVRALQEQIASIENRARRTMITVSVSPRTTRVLPRGNWLDESGPIVEPAIPEFMGALASQSTRATRLDLANWLTDCEHGNGGQTARVLVNRIWYLLMGTGLSSSLDDFGGQGQPPEHPELLDHLALQLIQSDWDIKHLVRQIVLSSAYQQSSQASPELRSRDPFNRLYARQTSQRLPAEMIRDAALAVSGLLVNQTGGDSIKPYQPAGYYRHLNFPERKYQEHIDERQWRRGVYVHWQRQFLHPALKAFDAPSREECTAERPRSNTPLAALALLNDPSYVETARGLAARVCGAKSNGEQLDKDDAKIQQMFRYVLSRAADEREQALLSQLLAENRAVYGQDAAAAQALLDVGLSPASSDIAIGELAAWTAVARAVMNMDEAITRN